MKQEILCQSCTAEMKRLFPNPIPYPDEHVKFVTGIAFKPMVCDNCGDDIHVSHTATAMSMWADYGGIPYYPWESEYLDNIIS